MNRFVRNNLFLIIACVAAGVAAVGLLVFSIIRYTEMARCIAEIEQFRQQIIQLGKKVPYREKAHHPKMSVSLMS